MSGKPTVTLTLAGDEKKLTSAFDKVGDAAKGMGKDVDKASDGFKKAGRATEDWAEKSDTVDTRAMGFRDTITGLQDSFRGLSDSSLSTGDRLLTLGMGIGDLASGFTNLLIPGISKFGTYLASTTIGTWAITAAQTAWSAVTKATAAATAALNAVMRANPILFIVGLIAALVGAFILLWNKSAGFRNFWIGLWNGIKSIVGSVVNWIKGAWNGVVDFFRNIPGRIGAVLGAIGGIVKGIFKGAVNGIIDALNWTLDHSINWLIDRYNDVAGLVGLGTIGRIPHIPRLHTGGVVPGMPGQEVLTVLQAGEHVSASSQGGGGGTVTVLGGADQAVADLIMYLVRKGKIRFAG